MEALITRTEGLIFVILIMVAFALWLQRFKAFKSLGPVVVFHIEYKKGNQRALTNP